MGGVAFYGVGLGQANVLRFAASLVHCLEGRGPDGQWHGAESGDYNRLNMAADDLQ